MKSDNKVILVGGFHEIIELCKICHKQIIGIIDNRLKKQYYGYKILGNDSLAPAIFNQYKTIPVVIIPDYPQEKKRLIGYYSKIGFKFCNLIHPNAAISQYAKIGAGVIIQNLVNISANVVIEDFVKVNTYVNIMHDSLIEKYSTIAPNAVILGEVKISESCYIGANSTILPKKIVGKGAIVGAGAIVAKNVKESSIVMGIAAVKKTKEKIK